MMKSKLNQYKIIEGNTNQYQDAIDAVGSYFDTQQTKLIQITNDVSQNIHEYKDLRREMNEVDDTPTSKSVIFSTTQGNETTGSTTSYVANNLYDGSINLVDVEPTYNPKNHSVEISSPIYLEGSYSHVYIENDVLYVKDMDLTSDVTINLDFYTKKLERNYLFPGNEHPIKDDRYNVSKALNDDTELLIQQNKQIGMLGLITTCVLGVGLYVLSRK
jgi:hypothetical protein